MTSNQASHCLALSASARSQAQRARVPAPRADAQSFIVHGHAAEANGVGVAGLVAHLLGRDGKSLARSKTDANGYFKLEVRGAEPRSVLAVEASGRAPAAASSGASVRLVIARDDDQVFRADLDDVKLGEAHYVEAVISSA
jgi:hypothetical protein